MKNPSIISSLLIGSSLVFSISCGNNKSTSSPAAPQISTVEEQRQDDHGIYRVVLTPLNPKIGGSTNGTLEIRVEGDDFIVDAHIFGAPSGVKHYQNIMTGVACPDVSSDKNQDLLVDAKEASLVSGKILIPLDSDLSDQLAGRDYGPIANASGTYVYRRSTSLSGLLSDLKALDPDPRDQIEKLSVGKELNLAGRVVLIHGVKSSEALPETVESLGEMSKDQSMPIACGKIIRVNREEVRERSEEF